ncbi:alpha/beta hydrolase [Occallatibacter riparius]|uniref:Alpha/beta fold hydrolase n=1 Tax=Occallatibacter riparius TaxID=1002689 RepID=A0A9J7BXL6_9BACT|nr:alpha/beta fold hydrolase [Occallatibacter riparius]UWZ86690.1 alpha/beta fold hydrolase [Occallatibacter riparius]
MRVRRRIVATGLAAITMWLLVCILAGIFAAEGALHPGRNPLTGNLRERAVELAAENHGLLADVSITAGDGSTLRAWSIVPASRNGDAVILLHGQADNRAGLLGPAGLLLRHGYAVLLPDARAHGESGGAIATYGVLEADDIHRWVAWMRNAEQPRCVDGIGDSMGAAELLRSLEVEHGYCAVVAESSFSSFREVAYDRMGQWFGTGPWIGRTILHPAVDLGFLYAGVKYGMNLDRASPLHAVAASATPVLLIHGLADTNIPPRHSEQIKRAQPGVALWEPPHADHCGASSADPAGYEAHVIGWLVAHDAH